MPKALELIPKLLARTRSPFIEEARTSAMMLCKLILENNLEIIEPKTNKKENTVSFIRRSIINSKYPGTCHICGLKWKIGEEMAWKKGLSSICLICYKREVMRG